MTLAMISKQGLSATLGAAALCACTGAGSTPPEATGGVGSGGVPGASGAAGALARAGTTGSAGKPGTGGSAGTASSAGGTTGAAGMPSRGGAAGRADSAGAGGMPAGGTAGFAGTRNGDGSGGAAAGASAGGAAAAAGASGHAGAGGGPGGACSVENCGTACAIPELPAFSALASNAKLPDPFVTLAGTRMSSKAQWECRRAEIGAELQNYETGKKDPKPPGDVTGSVSGSSFTVNVLGKSFKVTITLPTSGTAPYPAIIYLDTFSLPGSLAGVAKIAFDTNSMGDQNGHRGQGFFFSATGSSDGAGALIAWAWGVSRVLDALEATPAAQIDPKHVGITGCSRNGKGALMIGAFDERIALTIPQESGSGGTALWRTSYDEDASYGGTMTNHKVQTLDSAYGEQPWFGTALQQFGTTTNVNKLPFDHHELLGMVAPRGLLILENTDYQWLGVNSVATGATAAQRIFQGLGVSDNVGFANSGHSHCVANSAEGPYVDAFVQKFLFGKADTDTKVWKISKTSFSGNTPIDEAKWIDWTVPTLD